MGMDLVEIVVEVEERFGLKITNRDLQTLGQKATVQDLADWVWERFQQSQQTAIEAAVDLQSAALHWLQSLLKQILPVASSAAEAFPADLPLTQLPSRPSLRWLYAELRQTGIHLPPLFPSPREYAIARGLGLITAAGGLAKAWASGNLTIVETVAMTVMPGLVAWALMQVFINHYYANTSTADTVGELAGQILARNPLYFSQQAGVRLTREQVNQIVIQILIETLPVDRDEVQPRARLVEDLGMD